MNFEKAIRHLAYVALAAASLACGKKASTNNDAPKPTQSQPEKPAYSEVSAIMTPKCANCHRDRPNAPSFALHEDALNAVADEVAERITSNDPAKVMPQQRINQPLTDAEKTKIRVFIGKIPPEQGASRLDFTADINPILVEKCAKCHGDNSRVNPKFVGHEAVFLANVDDMDGVITGQGDKGIMPPPSIDATLSDQEKATILNYLGVN